MTPLAGLTPRNAELAKTWHCCASTVRHQRFISGFVAEMRIASFQWFAGSCSTALDFTTEDGFAFDEGLADLGQQAGVTDT